MTALDYEKFRKVFYSMESSKKWELSTGTIVENNLYNFGPILSSSLFRLKSKEICLSTRNDEPRF
ncbi:5414_t:CDS:2 [Racocetra fulgida]|uniref:5414_t:CDS:1 n=1 Tax=Racocetra fulgida TaxID=60492 RepID=A0A9N9G8T6_9GLOM|nr:5414_t:CDS:2 [Racocetra fulgida]